MKNSVLIILVILYGIKVYSQEVIILGNDTVKSLRPVEKTVEPEANRYVYTYSGNLFTGNDIYIFDDQGASIISVDSLEVNLSYVQFIKFDDKFWANTNQVENIDKNRLAIRTYHGYINLYNRVEFRKNQEFQEIHLASNIIWGVRSSRVEKTTYNFYNKGFGELKKVNYQNLVKDLSDNPQSMTFLNKSEIYQNRSLACYILGVVSLAYGFTSGMDIGKTDKQSSKSNVVSLYVPLTIGIGSIWMGGNLSKRRSKLIQLAIDAYK